MCAMLNFDGSSSAPNATIRSSGTPGSSRDIAPAGPSAEPPKYRLTISTGKRSMPAGTGVCVVNTVDDRTTVSAVSKSSPASINSRMRSTPRKPACPSFMWNTSGAGRPSDFGERADRAHPADAGQDLLLDPVFLVAAVEPVGDAAQLVLVLRDVGIQQQQRDSAHLRNPHARPQLAGVGHRQLDQHRVVVARRSAAAAAGPADPATGSSRAASRRRSATAGNSPSGSTAPPRSAEGPGPRRTSGDRPPECPGRRNSSAAPRRRRTPSRSTRCPFGKLRAFFGLLLVPQRPGQVVVQVSGQFVEAAQERLDRSASSSSRFGLTCPSNATGSHPTCFHSSGSMASNRSCVGLSHDQRRLIERRSSAVRRSGRCARTVNRRRAFTRLNLTDKSCSLQCGVVIASPPLGWADHYGGYRARRGCNSRPDDKHTRRRHRAAPACKEWWGGRPYRDR